MFAVWEAAVHLFDIQPFILPAPSAIAESMVKWWRPLLSNSWATLLTTFVGFIMGWIFSFSFTDRAFTTETPTPCRPPDTL